MLFTCAGGDDSGDYPVEPGGQSGNGTSIGGPGLTPDASSSGDGGPGDGDLDGERTSFYACSGCASNDPSGVLAIVLAACCALLPRRRRTAR